MDSGSTDIEEAVAALRAGELVAFATETVYGLGADAESSNGIAQIFQRKGRPEDHPLIVHVASQSSACFWAKLGAAGNALAAAFWPGPLTLIATRDAAAAAYSCGQEPTIGLRCPSHPVAQALLQAFEAAGGHGVAAPSANLFGGVSPTRAQHVRDDFGDNLRILDGGDRSDETTPTVAGSLAAHYAPRTPLRLVPTTAMGKHVRQLQAKGLQLAVCSAKKPDDVEHWEQAASDPFQFGARIYALLREFDQLGIDQILIQTPPNQSNWAAVLDRLQRAQTGSGPD